MPSQCGGRVGTTNVKLVVAERQMRNENNEGPHWPPDHEKEMVRASVRQQGKTSAMNSSYVRCASFSRTSR